jgi:hypothetical protein
VDSGGGQQHGRSPEFTTSDLAIRDCSECLRARPASEFKHKSAKCRDCRNAYKRKHYQKHAAKHYEKVKQYRKDNPDKVKSVRVAYGKVKNRLAREKYRNTTELLNGIKNSPCMDCGNRFPPECMDFDHVKGSKIDCVGSLKLNPGKMLQEISKTELVCACCHRIRTKNRRPTDASLGVALSDSKLQDFDDDDKNKAWFREYYIRNRDHLLRLSRVRRTANKVFIDESKALPCTDCGKTFPPVCMDFDHVRGEKLNDISQMTSNRIDLIREEIDKTEVVCACCHRTRTSKRGYNSVGL